VRVGVVVFVSERALLIPLAASRHDVEKASDRRHPWSGDFVSARAVGSRDLHIRHLPLRYHSWPRWLPGYGRRRATVLIFGVGLLLGSR
jgi:hypothetical protein